MPQPRRKPNNPDLSADPLAPKPGEETEGRVLVGILGESTVADNVRLFLDVDFRKYYDLPREAVLKREAVSADRSPLGVDSSAIWVAAGTQLVLHQSETRSVEDEFLSGDFTAPGSFTPVEGPTIPRPGPAPRTLATICTQLGCPSEHIGCGETTATVCTQAGCFSQLRCPPRTRLIGCPDTVSCPPVTRLLGCSSRLSCPPITRLIGCSSRLSCPTQLGCPSDGPFCGTLTCSNMCPTVAGCPSDVCRGGGGFDPGDF
jgi:hypothetical protein